MTPTKNLKPIVIFGGDGMGVIIAEAIKASARAGLAVGVFGFLNDMAPPGREVAGIPIVGRFDDWRECPGDAVFITAFHKAKEAQWRFARLRSLAVPEHRWATIVHPAAQLACDVKIGPGSFVGAGAVIEPGVRAGRHVSIRGGSYVSHDVDLGDYVFVGPNATLLGQCRIGEGAHVAANAVCREETTIGRYSVVGVGAAAVRGAPDFAVLAGNPARIAGYVSGR